MLNINYCFVNLVYQNSLFTYQIGHYAYQIVYLFILIMKK